MTRKPFSKTHPLLRVGGRYRNGPGQVREVLSIENGTVTFKVVDPGPQGDAKFSQLLKDHQYRNKEVSFRGWAVAEVPHEG